MTDRATLNGILERTDAYATGSGFLDAQSVNGITVIPLEDNLDNKMVYVRRKGINLSSCVLLKFVNVMFDYFDTYKTIGGFMRKVAIPLAILSSDWFGSVGQALGCGKNIALNQVHQGDPWTFQLDYLQNRGVAFDFTGSEIFLCDFDGSSDWCGSGLSG